jgi:hypothetical protein
MDNLIQSSLTFRQQPREETDLAWDTEPDPGSRRRQRNGQPEQSVAEDERLLDHHIEELLAAISDAAVRSEGGLDAGRSQLV